ncbi:MAG: PhzF family phenazine biosynthesis protein [Chloroflexi bacterium]|nr:MAG: PhzF family phenazine biosynthesis protein [Chloroflexota bacterium]
MPTYRFKQVDAFTSRPFYGNPVAVVLDADDLSDEQMQRIANWTNLSETTFVLKPTITGPAYRLRIFTPAHELPFAGHPTIGSCHAVIEGGIVTPNDGRLVQECGAGNLPLRIEGAGAERRILVEAPEAKLMGEHPELSSTLSQVLGSPIAESPAPTAFRNGPTWLFVRFETEPEVAALKPDMSALAKLSPTVTGVAAFAFVNGGEFAVHIRCFAPVAGVPEDPVTGSANAALPAYLVHHGLLEKTGREYIATQATEMGRDGRVCVRVLDTDGRAEIGGHAVTVVDGEIRL